MTNAIAIVPYEDGWPAEFGRIGASLREVLGDLAMRIDHIGSTAVPGLAAKDVIDVQVTAAALEAERLARALVPLGYALRDHVAQDHVPPGRDATPAEWRKLFFRTRDGQRRINLHVREVGRANQRYALLFRDYLRATPTTAAAYGRVKVALARLHPDSATIPGLSEPRFGEDAAWAHPLSVATVDDETWRAFLHQPNRPTSREMLTDFLRSLGGLETSASGITAYQAQNVCKQPEGHA